MGKSKSKSREKDKGREKGHKSSKKKKRDSSGEEEAAVNNGNKKTKKKHTSSSSSSSKHRREGRDSRNSAGGSSSRRRTKESGGGSSSKKRRNSDKDKRDDDAGGREIEVEIQISDQDYFTRATEFKVWLFNKKKLYFEDLTSERSHELFDKFVKDWNRGKLEPHFYEGRLPEELVARAKKTQHKWGFMKNLTDRDHMQLATANDSVHASTEKVKGVTSNVPVAAVGSVPAVEGSKSSMTGMMPPPPRGSKRSGDSRRGDGGAEYGDESGGSDRRTERKRQRKGERDRHAVVLDEIAPKETGRQAIVDKRRAVGAQTHAAAKEREDAADGLDLSESATMGGGDSYQEMLARTKNNKQRRQTAKEEKLMGLAAKEEEKRAAFLAQMGLNLKAGQKITIQPRRDG